MRRPVLLSFAFLFFASFTLSAQTPPQFMAAFGGGNVKGKWIGKVLSGPTDGTWESDLYYGSAYNRLNKGSNLPNRAFIDFDSYAINYKIYSLFGEPVFDFQFLWENPTRMYVGEKFGAANTSGVQIPSTIAEFPKDLRAKIAKLRPINVRFMVALSNKSYFSKLVFSKRNLVNEYKSREDLAKEVRSGTYGVVGVNMIASSWSEMKMYRPFSIDIPESAGKWQTYSVPGSPNWKDLPPYFKRVFKDRKDPDDLFVSDVALTEIEWPEYEIESIVSEYLNRKIAERRKENAKAADFWDTPVAKGDLPVPKAVTAPAPSAEKRESERPVADKAAKENFKVLDSAGKSPATISVTEVNKMRVALNPALGAADLVFVDVNGKEIARASLPAGGKPVDLAATAGVARIDVYRAGEPIGSIPWSYMDVAKGLVEINAQPGPYRVRVSLEGKDVFDVDCRSGPQKILFTLPNGYSASRLPTFMVTTNGLGSYLTDSNRRSIAAKREREERRREERRKKKDTGSYFTLERPDPGYQVVYMNVRFGQSSYFGDIVIHTSSEREENYSDLSGTRIELKK
ncbi:MAG: hypothetical protein WCT14_21745 [Treponemataceae bacterium]